ncbi:outer membrane protein assembly factor [Marinobacterium zhoushanense]|uniref:Translocation and assembly module subunit TamA n=1 Tax=Marinobacterium zhoushanense TaxID=1679163 RepID=A0ABQ1K3H2_9GAMM|nr:autotransporter assembly complex family protein [Marinobacterium zhoushanense]GGB86038.1 outer membrane protein assembly factor [Marinobacterium zhoushanense]
MLLRTILSTIELVRAPGSKLGLASAILALLLLGGSVASTADAAEGLEVVVEGIGGDLESNVRAHLSLSSLDGDAPLPSASRIRYLHRQAAKEVDAGLRPLGYFNSRVEAELAQTEQGWRAIYTIDAGPRAVVRRSELDVTGAGASEPLLNNWLHEPALQPGTPLDQQAYESIKTELLEQAAGLGYYEAGFSEALILVDLPSNSADIKLSFDTGPLYRLAEIQFNEVPIREALLQRYRTLADGEPVATDRLLEMQRGLVDSGYFSGVEVQPLWDQADDQQLVPVQVYLTPDERTAYRFGAGYGTDTGARLSASQRRRWVNDRGHRMESILRLSEVTNTLLFNYEIPGQDPVSDTYLGRAAYEQEQTDTTDSETWRIAAQEQRARGRQRWHWGLGLEQETFRFGSEEESTMLLVPEGGWSMVDTDNRLNPSRGYRLSADLSAAEESLLSDTSFVQLEVSGKAVYSPIPDLRLLARLDLGVTATTDFNRIPASRRFFTGGDNTVRGYGYKELGPTDTDGEVRGGRYLLAGSLEFDYRVAPKWRGAVFWDMGNAFDSLDTPLKNSAGIGGRWQSPVGPVRVDLAKPLDDSGFRIHFTLGPDL